MAVCPGSGLSMLDTIARITIGSSLLHIFITMLTQSSNLQINRAVCQVGWNNLTKPQPGRSIALTEISSHFKRQFSVYMPFINGRD